MLPFKLVDNRKADEPPKTLGPPTAEEQAEIEECWKKVGAVLDEYSAQFVLDAPPVEVKIGDQVMSLTVPVKYGIRIKRG